MKPYFEEAGITLYCAEALSVLQGMDAGSVQCVVTSPPYWGLRDYGVSGQLGLEPTPEAYTERLVQMFAEVRRVLRVDGTLWLNLGDSYATNPGNGRGAGEYRNQSLPVHRSASDKTNCGLKPKDLVGIPWRVAFALQADGWWLRSDIIWHKPNPMPESVTDRPTKAHEYLFLLSKSERYHYDAEAIAELSQTAGESRISLSTSGSYISAMQNGRKPSGNGIPGKLMVRGETRNRRSVWTIPTDPYPEAHFATFPPALIEPCIKAGCPAGGAVLDPFAGSGTTLEVARRMGCNAIGIELKPEYCKLIEKRLIQGVLALTEAVV